MDKSINLILELIEAFPMDVQYKNTVGFYPLHTACFCGHDDAAIKLIELFPEAAQHKDVEGQYPLHLAMRFNSSEDVVMKLIEIFPDAAYDSHTEFGTVLHYACRENQSETVITKLIEINPLALQETDNDGKYPIHLSVGRWQSIEVIKILLDADPFVMERRALNNGTTPFHVACAKDNVSLVKFFMQCSDLPINIGDFKGKTPLHYSGEYHRYEIFEMILHHPDVYINATDMLNDTTLHKVVKFHAERPYGVGFIQKLLDYPFILIDEKNNDNQTPMEIIKGRLRNLGEQNVLLIECYRKIIHLLEEFSIKQRWQAYCYHAMNLKDL